MRRKLLFILDSYHMNPTDWPPIAHLQNNYDITAVCWKKPLAYIVKERWFLPRLLWYRADIVWQAVRLGRNFDAVLFTMPPPGVLVASLVRMLKMSYGKIVWLSLIDYDKKGLRRFERQLIGWALPAVSAVTVASERIREYYRRLHGPAAAEKMHILPDFVYSRSRGDPPEDLEEPYIFSGGRSLRDWQTLFATVRLLPHVSFVVVGGSADDSLRQVMPYPPNVRLLLDQSPSQFRSWLGYAQFVVLPFRDPDAAVGVLVLMQSLEFGKAIVATRTGLTSSYITDRENGLLVSPHDPHELAQKIDWLLEHEEERHRMEACSAQIGERYGIEAYCQGLQRIIDALCTQAGDS